MPDYISNLPCPLISHIIAFLIQRVFWKHLHNDNNTLYIRLHQINKIWLLHIPKHLFELEVFQENIVGVDSVGGLDLTLRNLSMEKMSQKLVSLTHLRLLRVRDPRNMACLTQLQQLYVWITKAPRSITFPPFLQDLVLSSAGYYIKTLVRRFITLPNTIQNLKLKEMLWCDIEIPPTLHQLQIWNETALKGQWLPNLHHLTQLHTLSLVNCNIQSPFCFPPHLIFLEIVGNSWTGSSTIGSDILALKALKTLRLLIHLPDYTFLEEIRSDVMCYVELAWKVNVVPERENIVQKNEFEIHAFPVLCTCTLSSV